MKCKEAVFTKLGKPQEDDGQGPSAGLTREP